MPGSKFKLLPGIIVPNRKNAICQFWSNRAFVNGYCAARANTVSCSTNERGDAAPSSYTAKGANMNGFISNNSMMMCMCAGMMMPLVSSPAGSARCPRMM